AKLAGSRKRRGDFPVDRVLAIGEGMPTDVRGALNYGLDLLYIRGGIHAKEYTLNGETEEAILNAYIERENAAPKWW
ncbi:HAD hydrolase-like protein, partial [Rhizobium leguminosarum]|uniref:HAD hydrolase-like protein n=1 Tax=Rhizobium leguminosarum TaxID=384 RepID=UPI003F9A8851